MYFKYSAVAHLGKTGYTSRHKYVLQITITSQSVAQIFFVFTYMFSGENQAEEIEEMDSSETEHNVLL